MCSCTYLSLIYIAECDRDIRAARNRDLDICPSASLVRSMCDVLERPRDVRHDFAQPMRHGFQLSAFSFQLLSLTISQFFIFSAYQLDSFSASRGCRMFKDLGFRVFHFGVQEFEFGRFRSGQKTENLTWC